MSEHSTSGGGNGRRAMPAAYKVGLSALAMGPCEPGDELGAYAAVLERAEQLREEVEELRRELAELRALVGLRDPALPLN